MNRANPGLSLCWGSLLGADLQTLAAQASRVGFTGITLNSAIYEDALASGLRREDIPLLLADLGLQVSNIDPLFSWFPNTAPLPGDDVIARSSCATVDQVFDLALHLGTDLINAPLGLAQPDSEAAIVDAFGALCNRAARHGLRISLEFMPFNAVDSLNTAHRIVKSAGCINGGIMFDCWHHHRTGGDPDDLLTIRGDKIFAVQLDDAAATPMLDVMEETLNYRLLPGEGCIDLPSTLSNLRTIKAVPRFDVEVFSVPLRDRPIEQQADALFTSSASLFQPLAPPNSVS
ncbi:MAG: sugar phosphate isomerase/epimerase [Pseudomonadota bacterium]